MDTKEPPVGHVDRPEAETSGLEEPDPLNPRPASALPSSNSDHKENDALFFGVALFLTCLLYITLFASFPAA